MWHPKKVEKALFYWGKWRCSLIDRWMRDEAKLSELSPDKLRLYVKRRLSKLGLAGTRIEVYWICSLVSDLNLDNSTSFNKIVIPDWLQWWPVPYKGLLRLNPGARMYPPWLVSKNDIDFAKRQDGPESRFLKPPGLTSMLLSLDHELFSVIGPLRGRSRKRNKPGRPPEHPDHLTVKCAALKTKGLTYVEIAERFHLPVTRLYSNDQSDVARHLVDRGKKLINEWELGRLK
jgi:hypothetical protein